MKKTWLIALTTVLASLSSQAQNKTTWGSNEYDGAPWVQNVSKPNTIDNGLENRHISLWASHGRYYDAGKGVWKWQRPILFLQPRTYLHQPSLSLILFQCFKMRVLWCSHLVNAIGN